jgi:hypothetical protein
VNSLPAAKIFCRPWRSDSSLGSFVLLDLSFFAGREDFMRQES